MRLKNLMRVLFVFLLFSYFGPRPSALGAFEDTGTGARATALGSNFVSMGDDILSLMYNPAALARVQQKEITTEYSKLYAGLTDGSNLSQYYFGYGQPVQWGGTLALGWKQFSLDSLYTERTLSLGYGEWLTSDVAIGGALKQLYHSFGVPTMIVDNAGNQRAGTPNFFSQYGNTSTAYSADLGVLYRISDRATLGMSIQDVNEPNVALNPNDHEIVPRTIQMSASYLAPRQLTLAAGLSSRVSLANQRDTIWTGSAEKGWKLADGDEISLRGSLASGSREYQQAAFGAGYRLSSFQVDYAFVFNLSGIAPGNTTGTHRFSLTYRFGPKGIPAKAQRQRKKRTPAPKMPEGYEEPIHQPSEAAPSAVPAPVPQAAPRHALPRELEIEITPEDIEGGTIPLKVEDISMSVVFDSDYDGIPDDQDQCPGTPFGLKVDQRGCSSAQLDSSGRPLPKSVEIEFLRFEEGSN